jgi:pimeloyl-ACP methyl ester carboxylesterase
MDAIGRGLSMGVFEALFAFMNTPLSDFTKYGETSDQIFAIPEIAEVVNGQELGKTKINAPVFLYHGTGDEFIPLEQALNSKRNMQPWRQYILYGLSREHITTHLGRTTGA